MYKGATGNLNSIVALLTIPIGISFVDFGPLKPFNDLLLSFVVNDSNGKPLTLYSVTGIPYWILVIIFLVLTVLITFFLRQKSKDKKVWQKDKFSLSSIFTKSWKPWQAGILIGVVGVLAWLSSLPVGRNYPLGVTHGVNYAYQLIIDKNVDIVYKKPVEPAQTQPQINQPIKTDSATSNQATTSAVKEVPKTNSKKITLWLVLLVLGFIFGAFVSGKMSGQAKLLPKPPGQVLISGIGGFLIGAGAALGSGCVIGNILSGWAMMSIGMFIFGIATLIGNWITTYFYLIGFQNNKKI
jgi:hypothetical protein